MTERIKFLSGIVVSTVFIASGTSTAFADGGPAWDFIFKGDSLSQLNQPAPNINMSLFIGGPSTSSGTFSTPDGLKTGTILVRDRGHAASEQFADYSQFRAVDAAPAVWTMNASTDAGSAQYHFTADFSQVAIPQVIIDSPFHDTPTNNLPTFSWSATGTARTATVVQISNADFSVNINQELAPGQTSFTVPSALPVGQYNFYLSLSLAPTTIPVQLTRVSGTDLGITPNGTFTFLSQAIESFTVNAPGDANSDGKVNIVDLGILASHWQQAGTFATGDFTGDGVVNISDLGVLASNWQSSADAPTFNDALALVAAQTGSSVPEPALLSMLAVGALVVRRPRVRQVTVATPTW